MIISKRAVKLTDREIDVLVEAARGHTNEQIASRLYVEEATVRRHLANAYKKMEVDSRAEATRKGLEVGLITLSDILWGAGEKGKHQETRDKRGIAAHRRTSENSFYELR
jgi:DNA-binding CsgD family transcriptional regulator